MSRVKVDPAEWFADMRTRVPEGMEESPTYHVAMAIQLVDPRLPYPERWEPSNIARVKVIDAAPYRKDQFNWETVVPRWGKMETALFRAG